MNRFESPRRGPRFTLLILTLLSVTIVTLDANDVPVIGALRGGLERVLTPVGNLVGSVTSPVREFVGNLGGSDELRQENEQLRERVAQLEGDAVRDQNAQEQLRRLQEQLGIDYLGPIGTETARVLTGPYSNFDDFTVRIDKGEDHSITEGMPVVTKAGLVGRVQRVEPNSSIVQLLIHPEFSVGIRLVKSQDLGVGHGGGHDAPFIVDKGVELSNEVQPGDAIISSGLEDSVLPPNIPIGRVTASRPNEAAGIQELDVQPAAELGRLDVVQVLRWTPKQ